MKKTGTLEYWNNGTRNSRFQIPLHNNTGDNSYGAYSIDYYDDGVLKKHYKNNNNNGGDNYDNESYWNDNSYGGASFMDYYGENNLNINNYNYNEYNDIFLHKNCKYCKYDCKNLKFICGQLIPYKIINVVKSHNGKNTVIPHTIIII